MRPPARVGAASLPDAVEIAGPHPCANRPPRIVRGDMLPGLPSGRSPEIGSSTASAVVLGENDQIPGSADPFQGKGPSFGPFPRVGNVLGIAGVVTPVRTGPPFHRERVGNLEMSAEIRNPQAGADRLRIHAADIAARERECAVRRLAREGALGRTLYDGGMIRDIQTTPPPRASDVIPGVERAVSAPPSMRQPRSCEAAPQARV